MAKNIYGGGANTNRNGLEFEQLTSLNEALINSGFQVIADEVYVNGDLAAISAGKNKLYSKVLVPRGINYQEIISKKMLPDEALFVVDENKIFVIEKKFQNVAGSVDEKLQTCGFKKQQYQKLFSPIGIDVEYIYIFNDFFKHPSYKDVLSFIHDSGCHYFYNEIPLDFLELPTP